MDELKCDIDDLIAQYGDRLVGFSDGAVEVI